MNKDEIIEEIVDQPWMNVFQVVLIIGVGQAIGFCLGWLAFG